MESCISHFKSCFFASCILHRKNRTLRFVSYVFFKAPCILQIATCTLPFASCILHRENWNLRLPTRKLHIASYCIILHIIIIFLVMSHGCWSCSCCSRCKSWYCSLRYLFGWKQDREKASDGVCGEGKFFFFCLSGRALLIKVWMSVRMILLVTNAIYAMALELEILQNSDHSCSKCGQHCPFQTTWFSHGNFSSFFLHKLCVYLHVRKTTFERTYSLE